VVEVPSEELLVHIREDVVEPESVQLTVVVPAYNEEQAIEDQLRAIREALRQTDMAYEVLVIDDGSEDRTAERAGQVDGVRIISHGRNRGYGAALKTGIRRAAGDIILIIDSDGQHPAHEIPRLVEALRDCDMAVGARIGAKVHTPLVRRPVKWFLNTLASYLAGTHIPDLNSGLRAFRRLDVLPLLGFLPSGFSFTSTITLAMLCSDMFVSFIPVDCRPRKGKSKIRALPDTYNFIILVLRTVACFNPLKIFGPLAFALLVGGAVRLGLDVFLARNVGDTSVLLLLAGLQVAVMGLLAEVMTRLPLLPRHYQDGGDRPRR